MNDELAGSLTSNWVIPAYARPYLWLDSEAGSAPCQGEMGLFELAQAAQILTLRWGSDSGAPLTQLRWQPDSLRWDGSVRVGAMVESIHLTELPGLELPVAIITVSAQPLRPAQQPYVTAAQRGKVGFALPEFYEGVDDSHPPQALPLLAGDDSPLVTTAQDAMMNRIPLYIFGRLAEEEEGWHDFVALPIIWESVTLFAP